MFAWSQRASGAFARGNHVAAATYLENTARLRKKVKSAMMYPTAVTLIAIGITIFLLVKSGRCSAKLQRIWPEAAGSDSIPDPTQQYRPDYILYILPAMVGMVYGWLAYIKTKGDEIFGPDAHQVANFWCDCA